MIFKKFKSLVKKYHPDKNKGSKKYEDKLKKITLAYSQLRSSIEKKMTQVQFEKKPDIKISVKQTFGLDSEMEINAFSKNEYVPKIDPDYKFDRDTTLAILAGFSFNKKCLFKGIMELVNQLI